MFVLHVSTVPFDIIYIYSVLQTGELIKVKNLAQEPNCGSSPVSGSELTTLQSIAQSFNPQHVEHHVEC